MRLAALAAITVFSIAACERAEETAPPELVQRLTVPVSDDLPGLAAPATGIAFWDHPALSFNSMMITAGSEGVIAYNMEDGVEAARIEGIAANGAAVSYLGLGAQAAGILALLDTDDNVFRFYGIDNVSRQFLAIEGGPNIEGDIHGFCFGRAQGATAPSLYVLQSTEILIYNYEAFESGVSVSGQGALGAPNNLRTCAVDIDGILLVADDSGKIYRVDNPDSFADHFAQASIAEIGSLSVIAATSDTSESTTSISGQIILLDKADGAAHVFDRDTGAALGIIAVAATDQLPGVTAATSMGATSANLGALYRNGAIAYGVEGEESAAIRIIPYNAVMNALSLPEGTGLPARGEAPKAEDSNLLIETPFTPE